MRDDLDEMWKREATRLYRRYQHEVVEAYSLCPWAKPSRTNARMREVVLLHTEEIVEPALAAIDRLAKDESVDVAVLLFPRLSIVPLDFDRFVARVRDADAVRQPLGKIPFASAAFHPDSRLDLRDAERLIPFLRRSPDPTIQLVRTSSLDAVRGDAPQGTQFVNLATVDLSTFDAPPMPLRERIARANLERVERAGLSEVERVLASIRADRNASYQRLAAL